MLKLESVAGGGNKDSNAAAAAAAVAAAEGGRGSGGGSNLSMNQTLEGHEGSVVRCVSHMYMCGATRFSSVPGRTTFFNGRHRQHDRGC